MATIPVYRQQVVPNGLGVTPRASGQDPIGAALQNVGEVGMQIGEKIIRQQKIKEDEDARAWTSSALSTSHVEWSKRVAEMEASAEPGAPKFTDNLQTEFDKYRTDALAAAPNDTAKRFYGERLDALRSSLVSQGVGFQARKSVEWKLQQANQSADNVASIAALDPAKGKTMLAEQEAILGGYENKALAEHLVVGMRKKAADAALTGMVERDPAGALKAIDSRMSPDGKETKTGDVFIDNVDGEKLISLRHRAQSYIDQAQNRLRAETDKRMKEAEAATKKLQEFALTGSMVSPDYERETLGAVAGTPFEAPARMMIQQSYSGAAFGSQPLPAQQQSLRGLEATLSANGSDPRTQELLGHARTINQTQQAAYEENPWAAATRFARQAPTPTMQIAAPEQVPALIAQRLPRMTSIETYAGKPVSPLQPEETRQFLDKLAPLDPGAKAEVLSQAGGQLSVERINAWAGDMEKSNKPMALAMKLGYDRTTAGRTVAELVLRGSQALKDKTVKRDDMALSGWRSEISGMIRGSLGDARAEDEAIEAAYLVRAALDDQGSARQGYNLDASNEHAVDLVVGKPMERSGLKTILPRGMDESGFEAKLRTFTPEALQTLIPSGKVYIRGQERNVAQLSSTLYHMGFKRDGSGKYVPASGNAFVTLDKEGQMPLRLEMR